MRLLTRQGCPQGPPSFTAGEEAGPFYLWHLESFGSVGRSWKPLLLDQGPRREAASVACPWIPEGNFNWFVTLVIWVVVVLLVVSDVMVWAVSKTPGSKSPLLSSVCRKKNTTHHHASQEACGQMWQEVAFLFGCTSERKNPIRLQWPLHKENNPLAARLLLRTLDGSVSLARGQWQEWVRKRRQVASRRSNRSGNDCTHVYYILEFTKGFFDAHTSPVKSTVRAGTD